MSPASESGVLYSEQLSKTSRMSSANSCGPEYAPFCCDFLSSFSLMVPKSMGFLMMSK